MSAAAQMQIPESYLVDRKLLAKVALTEETLIGRETGFHAQGVSKRHCMVKYHRNQFFVADMNSTYGTFLNDIRLEPNQWRRLTPGDQLRVGVMGFRLEGGLAAPPIKKPKRALDVVPEATKTLIEPTATKTATATAGPRENTGSSGARENTGSTSGDLKPIPKAVAEIEEFTEALHQEYAGWYRRWVAASLDGFIMGIVSTILARFYPPVSPAVTLFEKTIVMLLVVIFPMAIMSQTIGKRIMGIRLITLKGEPLTLQTILVRDFVLKSLVPIIIALLLGSSTRLNTYAPTIGGAIVLMAFIWRYTQSGGLGYWDEACDTRVVRD